MVMFVRELPDILTDLDRAQQLIPLYHYYDALEAVHRIVQAIHLHNILDTHDYQEYIKPHIQAILNTLIERDETITPAEQLLAQI